jgi:hypothetical protein
MDDCVLLAQRLIAQTRVSRLLGAYRACQTLPARDRCAGSAGARHQSLARR